MNQEELEKDIKKIIDKRNGGRAFGLVLIEGFPTFIISEGLDYYQILDLFVDVAGQLRGKLIAEGKLRKIWPTEKGISG